MSTTKAAVRAMTAANDNDPRRAMMVRPYFAPGWFERLMRDIEAHHLDPELGARMRMLDAMLLSEPPVREKVPSLPLPSM